MFSSYKQEDVEILLKDITGMVTPMSTKEREIEIQKDVALTRYTISEKYGIIDINGKKIKDEFVIAIIDVSRDDE